MEHLIISVSGMTCGGCVNSVKRVVGALTGVTRVEVSLEAAQAEIDYDPSQTNRAAMIEAINGAGFEAS